VWSWTVSLRTVICGEFFQIIHREKWAGNFRCCYFGVVQMGIVAAVEKVLFRKVFSLPEGISAVSNTWQVI
tara:strand:+ start:199 stop:411 length:213 start_codon:yes stop_codon:yes gene_type:complete